MARVTSGPQSQFLCVLLHPRFPTSLQTLFFCLPVIPLPIVPDDHIVHLSSLLPLSFSRFSRQTYVTLPLNLNLRAEPHLHILGPLRWTAGMRLDPSMIHRFSFFATCLISIPRTLDFTTRRLYVRVAQYCPLGLVCIRKFHVERY